MTLPPRPGGEEPWGTPPAQEGGASGGWIDLLGAVLEELEIKIVLLAAGFLLLPQEATAVPLCSSLLLAAPWLPWVSEELALSAPLSHLTSSPTQQAAFLPNL